MQKLEQSKGEKEGSTMKIEGRSVENRKRVAGEGGKNKRGTRERY